jgi:TP901 family phage tail tape measure protein
LILRELVTKLGFKIDDQELDKLNKTVVSLRQNFEKIGVAAAASLAAVIVPAAQLQRILKDAVIASGATGDAFIEMEEKLRQRALSLSDALGFSGNEVARAFFDVISTGTQAGTEGFEVLATTGLKFAKAAGLETGQSIDRLSTASKAFFNNVEGATQVADAFFKANTLGQTTVLQLTEAIRDAGPAAASANVSLADTTALLTALADSGFKGALGGTAFRQVVQRLTTPVEKGAKVLKELGVQTTNADGSFRNIFDILVDLQKAQRGLTQEQAAANLKAIAGEEAFTRLGAILNRDIGTLQDWSKQIENSGGVMDEAFNNIMQSASEQFNLLIQNVKNLAATLGAPLLGPAARIVQVFGHVVTKTREIIEENKALSYPILRIIGLFLAIVAAAGTVVMAGKALSFIFGTAIVGSILAMAKAMSFLLIKLALLAGVFFVFEDVFSAIMGKESLFGKFIDYLDEFAKKSISSGSAIGYLAAGLKTILELFIVIPRLIGTAAEAIGIFAGALYSGNFEGLKGALSELMNRQGGGIETAMNFMAGRGVTPSAMASQNAVNQTNQVQVQVNVPEGSDPEQTAEAVRQGTVGAMNDMLRQTNNQFIPILVQ